MEQQYVELINSSVEQHLKYINSNIDNAKKGNFECLPIDFVTSDEVHLVFGTIVSRLRKAGYTVDITARLNNIKYAGEITSKYQAIISW